VDVLVGVLKIRAKDAAAERLNDFDVRTRSADLKLT
jgi:hypothetical protein